MKGGGGSRSTTNTSKDSSCAFALVALLSVGGMSLPVRTIDGEARTFPADADLPRSAFVVTFTKSASKQGSEWTRRLRETGDALGAAVFQVSVIEDVPKPFRSSVISAMARQIPQPLHSHFWIAVSEGKAWQQCVELASPKDAYVLVVEGRDRIVWRGHGEATDVMIREIQALRDSP